MNNKQAALQEFIHNVSQNSNVIAVRARDFARGPENLLNIMKTSNDPLILSLADGALHISCELVQHPSYVTDLYYVEEIIQQKWPDLHVIFQYGIPSTVVSQKEHYLTDPIESTEYQLVWNRNFLFAPEEAVAQIPKQLTLDEKGQRWVVHEQKPLND